LTTLSLDSTEKESPNRLAFVLSVIRELTLSAAENAIDPMELSPVYTEKILATAELGTFEN